MKAAHWMASRLFQQRTTPDGDATPKTWRARMHQQLFERGLSVPWIFNAAECDAFWRVPAGHATAQNRPEDYAQGPVGVVRQILGLIDGLVPADAAVLEVGCNAGSKLEQMRLAGFTNLHGVEPNPACFDVMATAFPALRHSATLREGPAEDALSGVAENSFELVFSVSSLQHVHPTRDRAFDAIARVASDILVTVEIEWAGGLYFFPRNYRRVFARRGFEQVSSYLLTQRHCPEPELEAYRGHVVRLLRKKSR